MTAGLELTPGTQIDGRYRIQRVLGRGGFGRTYLASDDRRFGDLCVLKEFAPSNQSDPVVAQKLRELFQREATVLHKLNHPQIPRFFAVVEENGRLFIVQEYINGKTYWRALQERQQHRKTFTEAEIVQWLKDLLKVLDYLHAQNIVHRDIAPDNIMLPRGKKLPVLIDFGVVKQAATHFYGMTGINSDGLIQASVSVGKFGYAPYEQIRMGQCSPKSDLYALAVTAVVLLTGKSPNLLIDPRSLEWQWQTQVRLNPRLVEILEKMMAEKPQDRYASARAILRDLHRLGQAVASAPALLRQPHPKYRSNADLTPSQLRHTGIKLVSPPYEMPALPDALPLEAATQITSAHWAELELTRAETPVQAATRLALDNDTELQTYTELVRSEAYVNLPNSARSMATQLTASPQTAHVRVKNSSSFYMLKNFVALGLLALLPLSGIMVGVQSPYIATVCQVLDNCVGDEQSEVRYRRAVEQAVGAKTLLDNAQTLTDLQSARDRLAASLAQLASVSGGTTIYAEAQQALHSYRGTLKTLETDLEKETRAAQLLKRAEAEAQQASEQTKIARSVQSYEAAELQWRRAVTTLKTIQPNTFAAGQVAARLQEYKARLQAVNVHTPDLPSRRQESEWLQPQVIQAVRSPQPSTLSTQPNLQAALPPASNNSGQVSSPTKPSRSPSNTQLISNLRVNSTAGNSQARSSSSRRSSAQAEPLQTISPIRQTPQTIAQPRPMTSLLPIIAASPNTYSSAIATGSASLSAVQALSDVSLGLNGAWINPGGTYVANLVLENYSDRAFGFVPLFAEVRDPSGQAVQSRILLRGSEDGVVNPGETLRGQLFLLDRRWNPSGAQNLTLVIQEGTSGSRSFHLPF